MTPGIKTTEFQIAATTIVAAIAKALGFFPQSDPTVHSVSLGTLAVLGLLFGMYYMSTRLKLKSDPTSSAVGSVVEAVTPQLKQMIVDRLTAPAQPAAAQSPGPSTLAPGPSHDPSPPAQETTATPGSPAAA